MIRRRVLYLCATQAMAFDPGPKELRLAGTFEQDAASQEAYQQWLGAAPNQLLYVITDVVEEDFALELIPHVGAAARRSILERKLMQGFRATPFRYAQVQGRESGGRRDDRVMLSALTNADGLNTWLEPIQRLKVPLAGIYSAATLAPLLTRTLPQAAGSILLITWSERAGLRQTFVQNGGYQFSRLISLPGNQAVDFAEAVAREAQRTQQYLANQRLLARNQVLHVCVLVRAVDMPLLEQHCQNTEQLQFHVLDMVEQYAQHRLSADLRTDQAHNLYASLLAHRPPANHYAPAERLYHYRLWLARNVMYAASALLLLATLVGGIHGVSGGITRTLDAGTRENQAAGQEMQYNALAATFPKTPVPPEIMKAKVGAYQQLAGHWPLPGPMLQQLSAAITPTPLIQLRQLTWLASHDPAEILGERGEPETSAESSAAPATEGARPAEAVLVEGDIQPFSGDYRGAFTAVQEVIDRLQTYPGIKVTPLAMPIDTRPQASVSGRLGDRDHLKALFRLRIVYTPSVKAD